MGQLSHVAGAFLCMAVGAGCGGTQPGMLAGTTASVVDAPGPGASHYRTEASGSPVTGPGAEAVARGVARAAGERGTALQGDGRLAQVAAWTADQLGEGAQPPPHAVLEFFAHHAGLMEPTPHLLILGHQDEAAMEAAVARSVGQFLARQSYTHFGAAVVERQGLLVTVMVLSLRPLEASPVPRRVAPGEAIVLQGTLSPGYHDPRVVVARPDGGTDRHPGGDGSALRAQVGLEGAGAHAVEVLAKGPRGDAVVANFPVYVGVDPPRRLHLAADEDVPAEGDVRAVETRLLRLMNQTRTEAGLAPLKPHEGLRAVARSHSDDMVANGFVGHTSPTTGTAPARVARAGIRTGLVLENIGRGYGAGEIHRGLMQSPGHRANILNPDVTDVGIGAVAEEEGDRTAFVVTQVFVRTAQAIDVRKAPHALLDELNRHRRERGPSPLSMHADLHKAAQAAAQRYFDAPGVSRRAVVEDATATLDHLGRVFRRVGGVMVVVQSLDEASQLEPALDPDLRHVGVGVAQGTRPDDPPGAIGVVLILGHQ
jgi:uncharacterized protein YkwD